MRIFVENIILMKMKTMMDIEEWFEIEDEELEYPLLPCVDNIWTE